MTTGDNEFYTIKPVANNQTHADKVISFSDKDGAAQEYKAHTSVHDTTGGARVLQDIKASTADGVVADPSTDKVWLRKSIERELDDAISEGRQQLMVPIKGPVEHLQRSEGVQQWYETSVMDTIKKIANSTGAEFSTVTKDGVEYANIKPSKQPKVPPNIVSGAFVAYEAHKAGVPEEQILAKLKERGYDDEDLGELTARLNVIKEASDAGMPLDDIKTKMSAKEVSASTESSTPRDLSPYLTGKWNADDGGYQYTTPKKDHYAKLTSGEDLTVKQLVSSLKVLKPTLTSDLLTSVPAYFGNKEAKQRYDVARGASRDHIIKLAKDNYNVDLIWEDKGTGSEGWYAQTPEGLVEVTPGFMQDLGKQAGEIVGGIGGAVAGARAGMAIAPAHPYAKVAGAAIGGLVGATVGSQADYLYEAMNMHADIEAEAMAYKALNASEAVAVGEALGYPIVKGLGAGWKGVVAAKDYVANMEPKAAYDALKNSTFLSDDQITDIVTQFERHAPLEGNKYQKAVHAVALTEPGMQSLVASAGRIKPLASSVTSKQVNRRAEDVLEQTALLTDDQVSRMLTQDLGNYVADVKNNFAKVKAVATQAPHQGHYTWDFDMLAIYPALDAVGAKITDPTTRDKFLLQMGRIGQMSEKVNFGDLLDLRQVVNDFLYNKNVVKADDQKSIRAVVAKIDKAIEAGAHGVLENPNKWLDDWADARSQYAKMKQVEKTAIYRAVFDQKGKVRPIQPEVVVNAIGRYATALDGSFEEVMTKLPMAGRKMYEGAVIDNLANKYTAGVEKGAKAVHFPLLAEELRKVNFTTPDARATKQAILEMSEVFKNDVQLAASSGHVTVPKFQSYLTADPVVRAKFEIASSMFNAVKSKLPGDANKQLALVNQTAKLLAKPLDAKAFKDVSEAAYGDINLTKQLLELQQEAARAKAAGKDLESPAIKIYAGGKLKGTGSTTSIPIHRVLTIEQAKEIADSEALTLDSKALDSVLIKYGYKAIMQGSDRVRMLGDRQ